MGSPLSSSTTNGEGTSQVVTPRAVGPMLRAGDLVIVRSPQEIFQTLDPDGTLDGLPIMPEMLEFCGKQFRVLQRVVQSTIDGAFLKQHTESFVREFRNNDVVILTGVRCSGLNHDGCQRGCAVFWKEAWLQKVDARRADEAAVPELDQSATAIMASQLKTKASAKIYFCQSSEFLTATIHLSAGRRLRKCIESVAVGNVTPWVMLEGVLWWFWWKARHKVMGEHVKGTVTETPTECLNLQAGELVEVKSLQEIIATLNSQARNRGLHFSGDQRQFCGGRYRVRSRADNFIAEGSGEMKHFRNTVILEDVLCDSSYFAFGGCYRADLLYWREIWLKRIAGPAHPSQTLKH